MNSNKLRVLNVIAEGRIGGPQLRILRVAKELQKSGIETIVAIPKGQGGFSRVLAEEGVPYREIPNFHRPRGTWNPAPHLRWGIHLSGAVRRLVRIIQEDEISLVHQNDAIHIQGAIAGKLAGRRVVWHINGMNYPLVYQGFKLLVYLLADSVVASSYAIGETYLGRGVLTRDFRVLYPPVDVDQYLDHHGPGIREELNVPGSCPLIAMIGNMNPLKGHLYFVKAAGIVKERVPSARFLIIGQHLENRRGYSEEVAKEVSRLGLEEHLIFTGFRQDIPAVLGAIDILVHPSLSESFGMVVAEAQAASKPVVATAVGGVKEVVLPDETGILVPPKDPQALADGVLRLLEDPAYARRLSVQGRDHVRKLFPLEQCAARYREVYNSVMDDTDHQADRTLEGAGRN